jgi:hypothetical protein
MIWVSVFLFGIISAGCFTHSAEAQKPRLAPVADPPAARVPVVVELFTSEGCSSCPPADRALKFLAEQQPVPNAEIIPLAFHVDYWNYLGWKDQFSSPQFSRRQELYVQRFGIDSSYTPQMVVDGEAEFVGNDTGRASMVITDAAKAKKGSVVLKLDGDSVVASISGLPEHHASTVFLAITEDGITSEVKSGENGGQTFNHSSVVRNLSTLGLVEKDVNSFEGKAALPTVAGLRRENSRVVVFVQDNSDRKILAVGTVQ